MLKADTYWLKYRHDSAANAGSWQWHEMGSYLSLAKAESASHGMAEEMAGEHGRVKYFVIRQGAVPAWVIANEIASTKEKILSENKYLLSLKAAEEKAKDCPQCKNGDFKYIESVSTRAWPLARRPYSGCPTCGRQVYLDSLSYILPLELPSQRVALKLLGFIVGNGVHNDRGWPRGADSSEPDGISPIQWLIDLGLAFGESSSETDFVVQWEATELGKTEWKRQKNHAR